MLECLAQDPLLTNIREIQRGKAKDFWSFRKATQRTGAHALIHYPAMMVPTLQGRLLHAIKATSPRTQYVLDPFVGSGTMLIESMNLGLDFTGVDINPLAVLACEVKAGPYFLESLDEKCLELMSRIAGDRSKALFTKFRGRDKWFDANVVQDLSRIARSIEREPAKWARRIFWLSLAKVIRVTCNSRMSTYKLHARRVDMDERKLKPVALFGKALDKLVGLLDEQHALWFENERVDKGRYVGATEIRLGDSLTELNFVGQQNKFDVVMTSPPYGDNHTTIPYGQFSYLPLKWIAAGDISAAVDLSMLETTQGIDRASLGGSLREVKARAEELCERFTSAKAAAHKLKGNSEGLRKFAAFFDDFGTCVEKTSKVTRRRGYQSWTIGNRRIGGVRIPMENILMEMLGQQKVQVIGLIRRNILAKKMAKRNNVSDTMSTETIVLARKS